MSQAKVLCISGMHRSGTSLTASWLETCGLTTHDGAVYGPEVGNPKGHFEDVDFVELHADFLRDQYPKSKGWIVHTTNQLAFSSDYRERAMGLVKQRNQKYPIWGWKDPRTVLFLEQWKQLIPDLKLLFTWRPCSEVSDSLIRRSRKSKPGVMSISRLDTSRLWIAYNRQVIAFKRRWPDDTLLISLRGLISRDREAFELIQQSLRIDLEYHPLTDLMDPSLLKSQQHGITSTSLLCRLARCATLETELASLSHL